jgi:hypothetical protein
MQWNVNAVFGLFKHRMLYFVFYSKTTLQRFRIAIVTKMQQIYCSHFAEKMLSFTRRKLASTVGLFGNRPRQNADMNQAPTSCGSLHIRGILFKFKILEICAHFSLSLRISFLQEIDFKYNLKMKQWAPPVWPTGVFPLLRRNFLNCHISLAVSLWSSLYFLACNNMLATDSVFNNTDLFAS